MIQLDSANSTGNGLATLNVSYWEQILTAVLILIIAVTGIVGNSMIIVAVAFSRKLQTSTNAFVTNLSVSDLLTSSFLIWYAVGVLGKNDWPLPRAYWICQLTAFIVYACRGTSLYILGTIGVNRLILITKPLLYKKIFSSWRLVFMMGFPWLVPGGSIVIVLLAGLGTFGYDHDDVACNIVDSQESAEILSITITLVAFPIPLLITSISYVWIYVYLKRYFRAKKKSLRAANQTFRDSTGINMPSLSSDTPSSGQSSSKTNQQPAPADVDITANQRERISRKQIEITKNLSVVVFFLFLCFLPYFILIFVPDSNYLFFYTRVITLSNSAINFFIYALKHPDFKVVLRCLCSRSYADIPQPSKLLKFLMSKN